MDLLAYIIIGLVVIGVLYFLFSNIAIIKKCPVCGSKKMVQRRDRVIEVKDGNHDLINEFADVCLHCGYKKVLPKSNSDDTIL